MFKNIQRCFHRSNFGVLHLGGDSPSQNLISSIEQAGPNSIIIDFGKNQRSQVSRLIVNPVEALVDQKLAEVKDLLPPPRMLKETLRTDTEKELKNYKMLIEKFHSLQKTNKTAICNDKNFAPYIKFMKELKNYEQNSVETFLKRLCSQIGAGIEIEIQMFPCIINEKMELIREKRIEGKIIRHCFRTNSKFMLGFDSNSKRVLGYDEASDYYNRIDKNNKEVSDWPAVIDLLKKHNLYNWKITQDLPQPDRNYEFRTIGKLDKNSLRESVIVFEAWYDKIIQVHKDYKPSQTETNLPFFVYDAIAICVSELGNLLKKSKSPLSSIPQLTVSFDISQLSTVINLITTDPNLYNGKDHDITTNLNKFFAREPIFPDQKGWTDDLKFINRYDIFK